METKNECIQSEKWMQIQAKWAPHPSIPKVKYFILFCHKEKKMCWIRKWVAIMSEIAIYLGRGDGGADTLEEER